MGTGDHVVLPCGLQRGRADRGAIGGLLISAGASPMLQLGVEGALCFLIAGIWSLRIGVGDKHATGRRSRCRTAG